MKRKLILILLFLMILTSCQTNNKQDESDKLKVVVSTTMLADLVQQVGQDNINFTMLFGPGIDPHLAQPTGGDTKDVAQADVVIFSGLNLESQFHQIVSAYREKTILVGEMLDQSKLLSTDEIDPHFWFNVELWMDATRIVGSALSEADPNNSDVYLSNVEVYIKELEELHEYTIKRVNELEESQKVLVTAHDAFNYFADAYGFEVSAIAGMSTENEVTTNDINEVASIIIENEVKSIFIESTVPQTTIDAVIAEVNRRGSDVEIGNELFSDAIGTGQYAQYIEAFKYNVDSIVEGLK